MDALDTVAADVLLGAGIEAIYAGVDWLSCSLPEGAAGQEVWKMAAMHSISEIAKGGYDLEARSLNGYSGYRAGGSFFGTRYDGAYLQLSGHRAADFLDSISRDDLHISRVDLQVTVKYRIYAEGIGRYIYRKANDANETLSQGRQRRIWYMQGNDGGYTVYIGSPKSEQRAKVYNKAVQSADPAYERCWRWETTAKNAYAVSWWQQVRAAQNERPMLCARMVAAWFSLRGAAPEWAAFVPLITLPLIQEVPSDAEKRLEWFNKQVAPALRWLVERGYKKEAMKALGMLLPLDIDDVPDDGT